MTINILSNNNIQNNSISTNIAFGTCAILLILAILRPDLALQLWNKFNEYLPKK
jgi:hypothetical protein